MATRKTVVITGARSEVARSAAIALARAGARVRQQLEDARAPAAAFDEKQQDAIWTASARMLDLPA